MNPISVVTFLKDGRPAYVYLKSDNGVLKFNIYNPGSGRKLSTVFANFEATKKWLNWHIHNGLISNNIGVLLRTFDLDALQSTSVAFDFCYSPLQSTGDPALDEKICTELVAEIESVQPQMYNLVMARSQSAYYCLEKNGLMLNYTKVNPKWSFDTYSGRSKSSNFNIQGWSDPDKIYQPSLPYESVLIHFDWVCADLRAASILSNDSELNHSFVESDPYEYLANKALNGCNETTRDHAKLLLLKTINKLDHDNDIVNSVYPGLCGWLSLLLSDIHIHNKSFNILNRPYYLDSGRTDKSLLNAVLQGSVASAIQCVSWNIMQHFPTYFVCDIHDGVVLSVPKDPKTIADVINTVGFMFGRPFCNVLNTNPFFPYKVYIGELWKKWNLVKKVVSDQN